nr:hypothetical protein [uncultured Cohaesibacter sp.]
MSYDIDVILRDNVVAGVPSSGRHSPSKSRLRQYFKWLERAGDAILAQSEAELGAIAVTRDKQFATVRGAADKTENGHYSGNLSTQEWVKISDLEISVGEYEDIGGTANAITANFVGDAIGSNVKLILMTPIATNTGPVTVVEDGGSAVDILSPAGSPLAGGELVAGVPVFLSIDGVNRRIAFPANIVAQVETLRGEISTLTIRAEAAAAQAEALAENGYVTSAGAVGDGVANDTSAFATLEASHSSDYVNLLGLTYLVDAIPTANDYYNGNFVVDGTTYAMPETKAPQPSPLWAGEFLVAQKGGAVATQSYRDMALDGMTVARDGGETGVTIYQDDGINAEKACRIQRDAGVSDTSTTYLAFPLSPQETAEISGNHIVLSFDVLAGVDALTTGYKAHIYASKSPFQPVINLDGTYSGGHIELGVLSFEVSQALSAIDLKCIIPRAINQICVVLEIPYSGTADEDDYISIEALRLCSGTARRRLKSIGFGRAFQSARSRFRTSLPYSVPRTATTSSAINAIAAASSTPFGVVFPIQFEEPMVCAPTVWPIASLTGSRPRIYDHAAGGHIFADVRHVGDRGFTITNNAAVTAGQRYSGHYVAEAII